ncbi:MAG: NAD(P)H-binding protein [Anaerolineaceae bacterium]|nr:NAD(P)H-binding protein [Anaerolineaceae bacterium]
MNAQILITGAPGNVGSEVVRALQAKGIPFRVGARDTYKARQLLGNNIEITRFDFLDLETYSPSFAGIDRLFFVRPPALSNVQRDIAPAIQAAIKSGVKQIVFLSLQGVEKNSIVPHHKIEQIIMESGIHYTFLRASFFMQNLSSTQAAEIRDEGEIVLPVGKAKTSFIDVRDIAAVAVRALTAGYDENHKYTLTGKEALDYFQVSDKLSSVLDRTITYTNPSVFRFVWKQLASGRKLSYTLVVAGLYTLTRFGNAKAVTQDVEAILGREPISFDQFAQDYRHCWQA